MSKTYMDHAAAAIAAADAHNNYEHAVDTLLSAAPTPPVDFGKRKHQLTGKSMATSCILTALKAEQRKGGSLEGLPEATADTIRQIIHAVSHRLTAHLGMEAVAAASIIRGMATEYKG